MTEHKRPDKWPAKIRTTNRPDLEIEVGPEEYTDLEYQGLISKDEKGTPLVERQEGGN